MLRRDGVYGSDRPFTKTEEGTFLHNTGFPRDEMIVDLLRTYRDLEGASYSGGGASGSRDCDRLLYVDGGDWDRSGCDALDELLKQLRSERPVQWWHTTERYVRCEVRPRRVKLYRTHSGRREMPKPGPYSAYLGEGVRLGDSSTASEQLVVVETWKPEVRLERARRGVRFLAGRFPWDNFRLKDLTQAAAA